jgi:nucleoside-diphosphate-sugar epimerase
MLVRVLLVGATDFLAPFVARDLLERKCEVAVLADGPCDFGESVEAFAADPRREADVVAAVRSWRADVVVDMLHDRPEQAGIALAASKGRVSRSVHLSSAVVYGTEPTCPVDEETELASVEAAPSGVAAQVEVDQAVLRAIGEGAPAVIVRLAELYGPRDPRCAEWYFAKRALDGRTRIAVPDAGLHICHRGFVQNLARGIAQAVTSARSPGNVYNLGEEKLYTLAQLVRGVARALDHEWEAYSVPGDAWRTPYDHTCFFDLRKARTQLRYRDRMIPRDGLELTLGWLCQNPRQGDWCWPGIDDPFDYAREDGLIDEHGRRLEA